MSERVKECVCEIVRGVCECHIVMVCVCVRERVRVWAWV